jgi:hypothetical protein
MALEQEGRDNVSPLILLFNPGVYGQMRSGGYWPA